MTDRHVFSFKNGTYYAHQNKFVKSHEVPSDDLAKLKPCRSYDIPFNDNYYKTWKLLPTPIFDYILDYQYQYCNGKCNIKEWIYILLGRLLYDRGELDDWELFPVVIGEPGTGKSLVLNAASFYEDNDLANIPTTINKNRFHNWKVICHTKYLCTLHGPVSSNQVISLIKGEEFDIPSRYQSIYGEKQIWNLPGIMEVNGEQFNNAYSNNVEDLKNHMLVFSFQVTPKQNDRKYPKQIQSEMGNLLRKCNLAYLEAIEKYGKSFDDIKSHIPKDLLIENQIH